MGRNKTSTEQFQLRLPPGLRDRVKANAEKYGRSTNQEIVRILEREFPPPLSLKDRLEDLLHLFTALKKVRTHEAAVEALSEELLRTLNEIYLGHSPDVDLETRMEIGKLVADYHVMLMRKEEQRREAIEKEHVARDLEDWT